MDDKESLHKTSSCVSMELDSCTLITPGRIHVVQVPPTMQWMLQSYVFLFLQWQNKLNRSCFRTLRHKVLNWLTRRATRPQDLRLQLTVGAGVKEHSSGEFF